MSDETVSDTGDDHEGDDDLEDGFEEAVDAEPVEDPDDLVDDGARTIGAFEVGPVAFGCWRFTHDTTSAARHVIDAALEAGMDLIDTADVYGLDFGGAGFGEAEAMLGRVLAEAPELRDEVVLATKGGIVPGAGYDASAAYLREACEASLRRLGVDNIDLYQVHRFDMLAHPGEVAETLGELRDEGKIAEIGLSNHTASQVRAFQEHLGEPVAAIQPAFSVVDLGPLTDGTFDQAAIDGTGVLAYSPLAGGRVADGDGLADELVAALEDIAAREGVARTTVALAFVLAQGVSPVAIVGSQNPDRLAEAARASEVVLTRADCYRIIEARLGEPLP